MEVTTVSGNYNYTIHASQNCVMCKGRGLTIRQHIPDGERVIKVSACVCPCVDISMGYSRQAEIEVGGD